MSRIGIFVCAILAAAVVAAEPATPNSAGVKRALKSYVDRLEMPGYVSVLIEWRDAGGSW